MYSGAQVSLYPMVDDFVEVIQQAIGLLSEYNDKLRIKSDDLSTLLVGPPETVFAAMHDMFALVASQGIHGVLRATVSRGCPGEPDDPICTPASAPPPDEALEQRIRRALERTIAADRGGPQASAQFSLYIMGTLQHMDEIYGCIEFLKQSPVFGGAKNFCTRVEGESGPVFAALCAALTEFGPPDGHVTLDVTVSANSPSHRRR